MGFCILLRTRTRPGHSHPCNAEAKNERSYITTPPIHFHSVTTHVMKKKRSQVSWTHYRTVTDIQVGTWGRKQDRLPKCNASIIQQSIEYFWGVTPCRLVSGYRRFKVIACNATVDCVTLQSQAPWHDVTSWETWMTSQNESEAISLCRLSQ